MNPIANKKTNEILKYLSNDLEKTYDTVPSIHHQLKGIDVLKDTHNLEEKNFLSDNQFHGYFKNSFSKIRTRFDEYCRIYLTSKKRK